MQEDKGISLQHSCAYPGLVAERVVYVVMVFSTLQVNTVMLAASSTAVKHAKCYNVSVTYSKPKPIYTQIN